MFHRGAVNAAPFGGIMKELKRIRINGKEYPIRCNIRVLGEIQEVCGNLREFEIRIRGLEKQEEEGGAVSFRRGKEPDYGLMVQILPLMVNEGISEARRRGEELEPLTTQEILEGLEEPPAQTAQMLFCEYAACFTGKKQQPRGREESGQMT